MLPNYERPRFDPELAKRLQKPARGEAVLARKQKQREFKQSEKSVKEDVARRDGQKVCRLHPNCPHIKVGIRAEGVHLDSKGMAGDHGVRTTVELMIRGCFICHQGVRSIHSGHLRVKFLTPKKANGPIALMRPENERQVGRTTGVTKWVEFARERAIGVWMTNKERAS